MTHGEIWLIDLGIPAAKIEAHPFTGRTHQTRVHLVSVGLPIDKQQTGMSEPSDTSCSLRTRGMSPYEHREHLPTSIGNVSLRAKGMSPFERCERLAYRYANSSYRLMREVRIALCESFECLDARGSHRAVPGDLIHLDSAELFERVSLCPVRHF